jgi:hypothetical protein
MDSFFIELGKQKIPWGVPKYSWIKINKKPYSLQSGNQILTVTAREPEARIMKFALCPVNAGIPIFNKPNNSKLIIIDAGKPSKLLKDFIVGTETVPMNAINSLPAADMTLWQLSPHVGFKTEVFPGSPSPHIRLQSEAHGVRVRFLNLFYPKTPKMEQPKVAIINENTSMIKWRDCEDTVYMNSGKGIVAGILKSDAELLLVRKKGEELISFVMINGSMIDVNGEKIIQLSGGKGIAAWTDDLLAVSGKNVYNFTFKFPMILKEPSFKRKSLERVTANGLDVKTERQNGVWRAVAPFAGNEVLTW